MSKLKRFSGELLLVLTLIFAFQIGVLAQEAYELKLKEVVITAAKLEQYLKDVPVATEVITREEIEESGAKTLREIVEDKVGLIVRGYGGLGSQSSVSIRGSSSPQVLVMIDGRPINSITAGSANSSDIPLDMVERIEIIRSPSSSLYGANALGGVINIITKSPPQKRTIEAKLEYGSYNTQNYIASYGASSKVGLGYILSFTHQASDGFRDNSDYGMNNLSLKLDYKIMPSASVTISAGYKDTDLGVPGPRPPTGTTPKYGNEEVTSLYDRQNTSGWFRQLAFDWDMSDYSTLKAKTHLNSDTLEYKTVYDDWMTGAKLEEKNKYVTDTMAVDLQYEYKEIASHRLAAGLEWQQDKADMNQEVKNIETGEVTPTSWNPEASKYGLWVEDIWSIDPELDITPGLRFDNHSEYGSQLSPRLGMLYNLSEKERFRASIGTAYRAPTFNDLYWPTGGNKDLKPEKGWSLEMGLEDTSTASQLKRGTLFYRNVTDLIAWVPNAEGTWQPTNVNSYNVLGFELELETEINEKVSAGVNYTFLHAKQTNSEVVYSDWMTGEERREKVTRDAAFVPKNKLGFDLTWKLSPCLRTVFTGVVVGERVNYYANYSNAPIVTMKTKKLPSYFLMNAKVSGTFADNYEAFLKLDNIFDADYQEQFGISYDDRGYPMPGLTLSLGVKANVNI